MMFICSDCKKIVDSGYIIINANVKKGLWMPICIDCINKGERK